MLTFSSEPLALLYTTINVKSRIIFPLVLSGNGTWSHSPMEGHRMNMLQIYIPMREKTTSGWKKLRNEELYGTCSLPYAVRVIISMRKRYARDVAHIGDEINKYRVTVGNQEEKRPLGRIKCIWKKMLKRIFIKWMEETVRASSGWRREKLAVFFSNCNGPLCSIKYRKLI